MTVHLLTEANRKRVEIYFSMVDRMQEVHEAFVQWHDAGQHPDITAEQRAASEAEVREAIEALPDFQDEAIAKKLPTREMLNAYVLEEILTAIVAIKEDIAEIKERV